MSGIAIVFYYSLDYYANPTKPRFEPVHVDWTAFPEFYGERYYNIVKAVSAESHCLTTTCATKCRHSGLQL